MQTVDICVKTYQVFIGGFFFFSHSLPIPEFKIYYALGRECLAKDMGKKWGCLFCFVLILAFNSVMKIIICALSFSF